MIQNRQVASVVVSSLESIYFSLPSIVLAPVLLVLGHQQNPQNPGTPQTEVTINQYTYRSYFDEKGGVGSFEILRKGQKVYAESGYRYSVVSVGNEETLESTPVRDITGDGVSDLIVQHYSGGLHCCWSYSIFSLGEEFKRIAHIEGRHTPFDFKDIDGDSIYELIGKDWTFAYWETSFIHSPAPTIILRYEQGTYHLAGDLMKKPSPKPGEFEARLREVRQEMGHAAEANLQNSRWSNGGVPSSLWGYMLDLIYAGNGQLAWEFFNRVWSDERKGKKEFLDVFKQQLATSPYWPEIKGMNGWE